MTEAAAKRARGRPMPDDFLEAASVSSNRMLADRYGVSEHTVCRWRRKCGIQLSRDMCIQLAAVAKIIPAPADLAERAAEMHLAALERHYGRTRKTIHRWLDEASIAQKAPPPSRLGSAKPKPIKKPAFFAGPRPWAPHNVPLPSGREQEAAQHLRRLTFVFRCHEGGTAAPRGRFWRYGNIVLTGEQLIERAIRHGYDPDAWRRVAA